VEEIVRHIRSYNSSLGSLSAWATIRWDDGATQRSADHGLLLKLPDSLRLEGLGPLGGRIYSLVIHSNRVTIWLARDGVAYHGRADEGVLRRLFSIPAGLEEALSMLCGRVLIGDARGISVGRSKEGLEVVWAAGAGGWIRRLMLEPTHMDPVSLEFIREGGREVVFSITWRDYVEISGVRIPLSVLWTMPLEGREVKVDIADPLVNVPLSEEKFSLTLGPSVRLRPLDELMDSLFGRLGRHGRPGE
jgi:hypothetical protein